MNKWVEIKPIGYIGLVIFIIGMLGPKLFDIHDPRIKISGAIVGIIGMYIAFKGRKEQGL
jgi:uncharacterized membrane protein